MKRRNNEQPPDKKPLLTNKKLWRKLTESSQAKVCGGLCRNANIADLSGGFGDDTLNGGVV